MRKWLIIYGAVAAVLLGLGFMVSSVLFEDEVEVRPSVATADDGAGWDHAGAPEAPPERDTGPVLPAVRVLGIDGGAQRLVVGGEQWTGIASGDVLGVDDSVRTEDDAGLTLGIGDESTVSLGGGAQVQVREVSDSVQRLGLVRGRISVKYKEDGVRVLRVENEDGSAVAEAREGAFSMLGEGGGVAVAAETGSVDLSAADQRVTVAAGQQSVVVAGAAPSKPAAIPVDLLLKVTDPGCRVQREAFIVIRGRTTAGSLVRVNDVAGVVDEQGRFAVRVPLTAGRNTIVVITEDVLGRVKRRTFPCVTVDPGAAIEKIDIEWGAPGGGGA